jgi:tetratricopeptide (TPR) repeat protein
MVSPSHSNSLYNYGVLLDSHCQRKQEAEILYRLALDIDPKHSFALYNLAVLREEALSLYTINPSEYSSAPITNPIPQSSIPARTSQPSASLSLFSPQVSLPIPTPDEVKGWYERAVQADPSDATTMADCGRFLSDKMNDPQKGEGYLKKALQINGSCDVAALHLGIIQLR